MSKKLEDCLALPISGLGNRTLCAVQSAEDDAVEMWSFLDKGYARIRISNKPLFKEFCLSLG